MSFAKLQFKTLFLEANSKSYVVNFKKFKSLKVRYNYNVIKKVFKTSNLMKIMTHIDNLIFYKKELQFSSCC